MDKVVPLKSVQQIPNKGLIEFLEGITAMARAGEIDQVAVAVTGHGGMGCQWSEGANSPLLHAAIIHLDRQFYTNVIESDS